MRSGHTGECDTTVSQGADAVTPMPMERFRFEPGGYLQAKCQLLQFTEAAPLHIACQCRCFVKHPPDDGFPATAPQCHLAPPSIERLKPKTHLKTFKHHIKTMSTSQQSTEGANCPPWARSAPCPPFRCQSVRRAHRSRGTAERCPQAAGRCAALCS